MLVIVGGNGFIGRHLRALLAEKKERAVIVSRNPASARLWSFSAETFVSVDDFLTAQGADLISQARALVYLASASVPATYADAPWREIVHNVEPATEALLKFAAINPNAKRILISSGGTIYGNAATPGAVDEQQEAAPISPYGLGKLMIETALQFAGRRHGVSYNILRLSNAVGHYHQSNVQGLVPALIRCLHSGRPFSLIGDGSNIRDFVDADDVADAIWRASNDSGFKDRIWNVGSGIGTSVLEVIETVQRVSGKKLVVNRVEQRSTDVARVVLDCRRISKDLGWRAKHGISEMVEKLWNKSLSELQE